MTGLNLRRWRNRSQKRWLVSIGMGVLAGMKVIPLMVPIMTLVVMLARFKSVL